MSLAFNTDLTFSNIDNNYANYTGFSCSTTNDLLKGNLSLAPWGGNLSNLNLYQGYDLNTSIWNTNLESLYNNNTAMLSNNTATLSDNTVATSKKPHKTMQHAVPVAPAEDVCINDAGAQLQRPQQQQRGFFGRMWDGICDFFGFGSDSDSQAQPVVVTKNQQVQPPNNERGFWGRLWDGTCDFFSAASDFIKQPFTKIKHWITGAPVPDKDATFVGATSESLGNVALKVAAAPIAAPFAVIGSGVEACTPLWNYFKN